MKLQSHKNTPVHRPGPATAPAFPANDHARLTGLLLALLTVLIYLPVAWHDFIFFDDPSYVTDNPVVQNGLTWAGLKWAFLGWHASNWHPLTWLSHELDCQLFGLNPGAQHLINVLFHAANAVLLFLLWLRLTRALWPSAVVAALFAWHPLHVESVAWISERKDVLSTFFGLLALLAYARWVREYKIQNSKLNLLPVASGAVFAGSLLGFALALLAKPMLVTLPCVMLLLDFWPLGRFKEGSFWLNAARLALEKWPFFLLSALSCLMTILAQRGLAIVTLQQYTFGLRLENALVAVAAYVAKTCWPVNLSILYPLPKHIPPSEVVISVLLLSVISLLAWKWRRTQPAVLAGWLWFLGMLVPVIGLVQVGDQARADRYTYLPAVGLFIAVVFGLANLWDKSKLPARPLLLAAVLVLAACVAGTEHQLRYWQDSEALFSHALRVNKNNGPAKMMLGIAYEKQGRDAEAKEVYHEALQDDDSLIVQVAGGEKRSFAAQVQLMFGQSAEQKGQVEEAINYYREALRLDPDIVEAHNNLGNLLDGTGKSAEAIIEYQAAVRLRPAVPLVHENLGTQLSKTGRFDEAIREYQAAAHLAPEDPQPVYLIGKACLRHGQDAQAATAFQYALHLNANDCPSLIYLARVLAADESPALRNGAQAVLLAGQASQLTGGNDPFVLGTLAMAYAEAGRFEEAVTTVNSALKFAAGNADGNTISNLQTQLQLYQKHQPFRESFANPARQ